MVEDGDTRFKWLASVACVGLLTGGCARSIDAPSGPEAYAVMAPTPAQLNPDYLMGPGDVISVSVYGQPDMSLSPVIVDPDGRIDLPLIGNVAAGGMTTAAFASAVEEQLRPRYLVDPRVSVNVTTYSSKFITIDGQVVRPGLLNVSRKSTLMSVVAQSGGTTELARLNEVVVFRRVDGRRMAAKFDLRAIRRGEMVDPVILPDDTVVVGFNGLKGVYRDAAERVAAVRDLPLLLGCDGAAVTSPSSPFDGFRPASYGGNVRIVHVITRFIRGGADENTLLTCNGQVELGHAVHLFAGAYHDDMVSRLAPGAQWHHVPSLVREPSPSDPAVPDAAGSPVPAAAARYRAHA